MQMNYKDKVPLTPADFIPSKAIQKEFHHFHIDTADIARQVIAERMPTKILALNQVLQEKNGYESFFAAHPPTTAITITTSGSSHVSGGGKRHRSHDEINNIHVEKDDGDGVSSEAFRLAESEFELLKNELLELVEMTSAIKLWLQLNIPRIEDGNNFGVGIQTDTVTEISRIEDSALMSVENWSKFLMLRAKVVGKMHKHRDSTQDRHAIERVYAQTLEALDEKQVRSVWIGWLDLRNNYAVIYDLLIKNIDKLVNPRSNNVTNMY